MKSWREKILNNEMIEDTNINLSNLSNIWGIVYFSTLAVSRFNNLDIELLEKRITFQHWFQEKILCCKILELIELFTL